MIRSLLTHALPLVAVAAFTAGCNSETAAPTGETAGEHAAHGEESHADGHDHATTGPHDGSLIELGDHEYLAELVHDETTVTIYLYEHDATTAVPIDAKEISINLMHDGQPEQFKLAAGDPQGKSSKFTIENADLASHLDEEAAQPQLMVTINGTPYSAPLAHHHDHEGHEH